MASIDEALITALYENPTVSNEILELTLKAIETGDSFSSRAFVVDAGFEPWSYEPPEVPGGAEIAAEAWIPPTPSTGPTFFEGVGLWFTGVTQDVQDWVNEQIAAATAWMVQLINDATAQLRIWRHEFTNAISEWLASAEGFWSTILIISGVAVTAGILAATGNLAAVVSTVEAGIAVIDEIYTTAISAMHLDLIFTFNDLLQTLIPDYRVMWQDLYTAFAGLAEELALGPGTIAGFLRNINTAIASTYALLGFPPEAAELQFFTYSAGIYEKIEAKFNTYAVNPQQLFDDIRADVLVPSLEEVGKWRIGVDSTLGSFDESLTLFTTNLTTFQDSINTTIEELPDEIEESVNSHVEPFITDMNNFIDNTIVPFTEKVTEVSDLVDDYIEREEERYKRLSEYLDNKMLNVLKWEELSFDDKTLVKSELIKMIQHGELNIYQDFKKPLDDLTNELTSITESYYNIDNSKIKLIKVPEPITGNKPNYKPVSKEWFRGEY